MNSEDLIQELEELLRMYQMSQSNPMHYDVQGFNKLPSSYKHLFSNDTYKDGGLQNIVNTGKYGMSKGKYASTDSKYSAYASPYKGLASYKGGKASYAAKGGSSAGSGYSGGASGYSGSSASSGGK